jgi:redox-sensitive bicupin YhaK (pirin superfamily)
MTTLKDIKTREIERIINGEITIEGGGFQVRRPFPTRALDHVDPFLLLDEAGPIQHKPGDEDGLPDHPHRGFETLTYILEGETRSHDSTGFAEDFYAGDVEWTTAGRGIIHGGGPTEYTSKHGGSMRGFQIWVNLPASKKMIPPQSLRIKAESIPVIEDAESGYKLKVLGGDAAGVRGPINTTWPILYLHYTVHPGGHALLDVPAGQNIMLYVFRGGISVGKDASQLKAGQLGILSDGDQLAIGNTSDDVAELIVLGAQPINEPVARYGPFVMNTREEVFQAFDDYNAGKFGL